jgi:hypothetical protein
VRHSCVSILLTVIAGSAVQAEAPASLEICNPMPSPDPAGIPPMYPPIIEQFRWEGDATVSFLITVEGRVQRPEVSFSGTFPEKSRFEIGRALQDFARQLRYPQREQPCMGKLKIRFKDDTQHLGGADA